MGMRGVWGEECSFFGVSPLDFGGVLGAFPKKNRFFFEKRFFFCTKNSQYRKTKNIYMKLFHNRHL